MTDRSGRGWRRVLSYLGAATLFALTGLLATLQAQKDPYGADWPQGEGRALTGAWCGGCHSLNLVKQQGMSRERWDDLLDWMSETQKMPPLRGEQRETVLDYLAANFGVGGQAGDTGMSASRRLPVNSGQGVGRLPPLEIRPAE